MRFMILVKANEDSEAGVLPDEQMLTEMGKFNEELAKAGVLLAGEGLQASSKGARVRFAGTCWSSSGARMRRAPSSSVRRSSPGMPGSGR